MRIKFKGILSVFAIALFLFLISLTTNVKAAEASITCNSEVEVNKPITISVKGSGVQWNLKLIVDGKVIATSSELDNYESNKTISFSKEYTPTSTGTKEIKLEGSVTEYNDGSTITNFSSKKITVKEASKPAEEKEPKPTPQKGTVTLCKINGIKVNEYINIKNQNSVSVLVNTSTGEGFKIYNNLTKKTTTGKSGVNTNVAIAEGTNVLTITLDSGYSTTRNINSTKETVVEPNVIEEEPEEEIKVLLKSLAIKGVISEEEEKIDLALTPEFSSEVYEYTLTIPPEQNDITKLDVEAIGAQEDFTIEITGNEELVDGENTVTILVKSKDGEKTATYQILVVKQPKEVEAVAVAAPVETTQIPQEVEQELSIPKILIAVFTSIIAIAGIVFGVIEYRYSKNKNGEFSSIPYANIGFDSENDENDKEDILGEFKEDNEKNEEIESISKNDTEEEFEVLGEEEKKPKKRGKHF